MLFSIGTRVKFRHTGDIGVITALLDNGMVMVSLTEEDMEVPTFTDDLIKPEEYWEAKSSVKAKFVPTKKDKTPKAPERPPISIDYTILKSKGIQLAFEPVLKPDGVPLKYKMYLINDTSQNIIYTFQLFIDDALSVKHNGQLPAMSIIEAGEMLYDELNDFPEVEMECWKVTKRGSGQKLFKLLKIKPKQFFKKRTTAPFLHQRVHLYVLFDKLESKIVKKDKEDLKSYTQRNISSDEDEPQYYRLFPQHDVTEYAEFEPEIDLHIEELGYNPRKMTNAEIIKIQLQHFEGFLEKAVRLGVPKIFVIHGVGKGKLRDEIHIRLRSNLYVKKYKNEWHKKYGYGATEVVF